MIIWLRHTTEGTTTSRRFDAIRGDDPPANERKNGRGLRRINYSHRIASWRAYSIRIGADQLYQSAARDFIDDFWNGDRLFLTFDDATEEPSTGWIEVISEGGALTRDYVKGHAKLYGVTLELVPTILDR